MKKITKKSEVTVLLDSCLITYDQEGLTACLDKLDTLLLQNKVKFPLLEYCGTVFYEHLPTKDHIDFCDRIQVLKREGGNVILGIMLQKRLVDHFQESIYKAVEYISQADIWYVCDIIGERVFGVSLLQEPQKTIIEIKKLSSHASHWVIRSLGAGTHYAIKKGLAKKEVTILFAILLSMANTKDKEIRQGVGWAAKTTAKFHPDIIVFYQSNIDNEVNVANWFRTKINIGLNRNKYAKGG